MSYLILLALILLLLRSGARRVAKAREERRSRADRHTYEVTLEDLNRGEARRRGFTVHEGGKDRSDR